MGQNRIRPSRADSDDEAPDVIGRALRLLSGEVSLGDPFQGRYGTLPYPLDPQPKDDWPRGLPDSAGLHSSIRCPAPASTRLSTLTHEEAHGLEDGATRTLRTERIGKVRENPRFVGSGSSTSRKSSSCTASISSTSSDTPGHGPSKRRPSLGCPGLIGASRRGRASPPMDLPSVAVSLAETVLLLPPHDPILSRIGGSGNPDPIH